MVQEWYSIYDFLIDKICPDYELGLNSVVKEIPIHAKRILELGCGTGNLTVKLCRGFPDSNILGVDKDDDMLKNARSKLKQYPNVELATAIIPQVNINGFEVVVSSLVFHLLPETEIIQMLNLIYKSEAKYFIMFDRMKGETAEQENAFLNYFAQQLQGKGISNEIVQQIVQESKTNNPLKLSKHKAICEKNGFRFEAVFHNKNRGFAAYRSVRKNY